MYDLISNTHSCTLDNKQESFKQVHFDLRVSTLVFTCAYWFIAVYPQGTHACKAQSETAA